MALEMRIRDMVDTVAPLWLRNRPGLQVGYKILWTIAAVFDVALEQAVEGAQIGWPGKGDPSGLPYIGRTREIVRGVTETEDHYAARLRGWLETHANDRTVELANQLHEYLPGNPRVRIIQRGRPSASILPLWIEVDTDGTVSETSAAWDWDSVSNPTRAGWWSDMWIVVYQSTYARRGGTLGGLPLTDDGNGLGLLVPHDVVDTMKFLLSSDAWKGAHSRVRCVLFTDDNTAYVPAGTGIKPNGNWGQWSTPLSDPRVASDRDTTVTRYFEPSRGAEP